MLRGGNRNDGENAKQNGSGVSTVKKRGLRAAVEAAAKMLESCVMERTALKP
jgi:hypothetical protein